MCGWQVKLCDPLVTHGPHLSALEVRHDEALYKSTFTVLGKTRLLWATFSVQQWFKAGVSIDFLFSRQSSIGGERERLVLFVLCPLNIQFKLTTAMAAAAWELCGWPGTGGETGHGRGVPTLGLRHVWVTEVCGSLNFDPHHSTEFN